MDTEKIAALRAQSSAAAPGRWVVEHGRVYENTVHDGNEVCVMKGSDWSASADLIMAAVNALPDLLDTIEQQTAVIARVEVARDKIPAEIRDRVEHDPPSPLNTDEKRGWRLGMEYAHHIVRDALAGGDR